ncbi:MAG: HipA family kinase [Draconibacterium sp.]
MKIVNSIARPTRVFDTSGNQPALILCDDFEFYVCKYNRMPGSEAKKLFHELIAGHFAQLWNLNVPEFSLVNVNPEHIVGHETLQPVFFQTLSFGSKYNQNLVEVDEFYGALSAIQKRKFDSKFDFLKIALFDIWMANDDRSFNNYNLLIDSANGNRFTPIDHDAIFNTGNLDKGLYLLSENETLIDTEIATRLFNARELRSEEFLKNIENEYYFCIENCKENLDTILQDIPDNWNINIEKYKTLLTANSFNDMWITDVFKHFSELIQLKFLK